MAPSSPGSRPRPPGDLRPAPTPAPGDAHRQRRGAGSNKPRSPRFQGIATNVPVAEGRSRRGDATLGWVVGGTDGPEVQLGLLAMRGTPPSGDLSRSLRGAPSR